jgi:hypothetical protein
LHAWQGAQLAEPQHTPSTQLPLMHWPPVVQASPFFFRAQLLAPAAPWQVYGATQSESAVQDVLQAPGPQTYGEQLLVAAVAHAPPPVQCETGVYVVPAQDAVPQLTSALACAQAPAPSHEPVFPHGGCGVQRACGSASPAPTLEHEPALPVTLQAWQVPQAEAEQHTLSTQKLPVRQSLVAVHAWPRRFLSPQRLVFESQILGARQSASLVHAALQAEVFVALQRYGAHPIVAAAMQLPTPSQVFAGESVDEPAGHEGFAHCVPAAKRRHVPLPSHKPSVAHVDGPWFLQVPCGSTPPSGTLLHVPSDVGSAHVWHEPLHAELQHTPCAQNFDRHSLPSAHALPAPLRPHEPAMQTAGAEQSASALHAALHAFAPHVNGKHELGAGVTQAPLPSHVEPAVNVVVSVGHVGSLQGVPLGYFWQPPAWHMPFVAHEAGPRS